MISTRMELIIGEFEDATGLLLALGACCDDSSWLRTSVAEGWSVAAVFHHVAVGNQQILRWLRQLSAGQPIQESWDDVHRRNAEYAVTFAGCEQMPTLRLLRSVRDEAIEFLEGLTDADLDRSGHCGLYGGARRVAEVAGWLAGHTTDHLDSLRAVLPDHMTGHLAAPEGDSWPAAVTAHNPSDRTTTADPGR